MQPFSRPPPHLLPFGQCIVEQTTLPLLNSLIVYCRVSSNFHFSLSIILFLVQKYWFIKKISRGGWSGFGKALVWIDPNCHENCLDWSKLFSSLSKLHPNRRCSAIHIKNIFPYAIAFFEKKKHFLGDVGPGRQKAAIMGSMLHYCFATSVGLLWFEES